MQTDFSPAIFLTSQIAWVIYNQSGYIYTLRGIAQRVLFEMLEVLVVSMRGRYRFFS